MSMGNRPKPLKDRLNEYQMGRRDIRKQGRSTVAAILQGQNNMVINAVNGFVGMNIVRRFIWILFGPRYVNSWKGYVMLVAAVSLILPILIIDGSVLYTAVRHLVTRGRL